MRFTRLASIGLYVVASALVAGCGDSTGPESPSVNENLADISAAQSLGTTGLQFVGIAAPRASAPDADACGFNATTQTFVCPSTTINGVTISRSFQLLDASNNPQSAYSPTTTAAIRVVTDLSGTINSTTGAVQTTTTLIAHDDATLSGLLTATRTLNSNGTANATVTSGGVTHTIAATQKITNLVLPEHGSDSRYPQAGSIAIDVTASTAGISNTAQVTMTFNGSSTATLVVTAAGVTHNCTIDLSKQHALPNCTT